MKKYFFIILTSACLFSCKNENRKIDQAKWILGNWKQETPEGVLTESWTVNNENSFQGNTLFILNQDTLFSEKVLLKEKENNLYYIVTLSDEINSTDTEFKLTSQSDKSLIFENPENDFPKKITYKKITNDSILAEISGGGNPQQFPLTRIK